MALIVRGVASLSFYSFDYRYCLLEYSRATSNVRLGHVIALMVLSSRRGQSGSSSCSGSRMGYITGASARMEGAQLSPIFLLLVILRAYL